MTDVGDRHSMRRWAAVATLHTPRLQRGAWIEILVVCLLGALAFGFGSSHVRAVHRAGIRSDFDQPEFGAAVAFACGRGFRDPGYHATPGLERFLARKADSFDCAELHDITVGDGLNLEQGLYRYLMLAAGLVWRIGGVSWSGLWPLFGVLFTTTILAAYGLFRLGMGVPLAAAGALLLVTSPVHLTYLPMLRDYAKAPFVLSLLLVMGALVRDARVGRRTLVYAAAFGVILGVGFGFRNDLLLNIVPFAIVVACCLPDGWRAHLRTKALALTIAVALFLATAAPVIGAYRKGSNTGHVMLLGMMSTFNHSLNVRAPVYDWGEPYLDGYAAAVTIDYGTRVHGRAPEYLSSDYDRTASEYLWLIARHWPADIVARAYAATFNILELPFTIGRWANAVPPAASQTLIGTVYSWRISLLYSLSDCGLRIAIIALLCVAARSVSGAAWLLFFLVYYAGSPAIQFSARHFFHLECIGWWLLGFVLQSAIGVGVYGLRAARGQVDLPRDATVAALRAAVFAVAATTIVVGGLFVLRTYQTRHVRAMLRAYVDAPRRALRTSFVQDGGMTLVTSDDPSDPLGAAGTALVTSRLLVAEFASSCRAVRFPVATTYEFATNPNDFSRTMMVDVAPGLQSTLLFVPAYDTPWSRYRGLQLPDAVSGCLIGLSTTQPPAPYRLLLNLDLPARWDETKLFQTLNSLEPTADHPGGQPAIFTDPAQLVVSQDEMHGGADRDQPTYSAGIARPGADGSWIVRGRADGPDNAVLEFPARTVAAATRFLVRGELRRGGVAVALWNGTERVARSEVAAPGPFLTVLAVPQGGTYHAVISHAITPWWPASHIGHRIGPLVQWIPGMTLQADFTLAAVSWRAESE
jgi:hypothetical protein